MPYSLLIDVVVALLLVVTIGYAIRLNKRLGLLRRDKDELEKLAATFAESTVRADESLGRLRSTADMMQKQLSTAQALHDDLTYLLDRGEKAADRLEDAVRLSRDYEQRPLNPAKPVNPVEPAEPETPVGSSEAQTAQKKPRVAPSTGARKEIEDINEGLTRPAPAVPPRDESDLSAQTEAERELLKALRSAN